MLAESQREFEESLNVSSAASISYGIYGGNASAEFVQTHSINEFSVCLIVSVDVLLAPVIMPDPKIKNESLQTYSENPETFKNRYGDMFVSALWPGGSFYGVLLI